LAFLDSLFQAPARYSNIADRPKHAIAYSPRGGGQRWTWHVFVAAKQSEDQGYAVTVTNLGTPGAVISPGYQELGLQYGRLDILPNFIEQELRSFRRAPRL
jgi:hypothetical protein